MNRFIILIQIKTAYKLSVTFTYTVLLAKYSALFKIAELFCWHFHLARLWESNISIINNIWLIINHHQVSVTICLSLVIKLITNYSWNFSIICRSKEILDILFKIKRVILVVILPLLLFGLKLLFKPSKLTIIDLLIDIPYSHLVVFVVDQLSSWWILNILSWTSDCFKLSFAVCEVLDLRSNELIILLLLVHNNFATDHSWILLS